MGFCPNISQLLSGALHEVIALDQCDYPIAKITSVLDKRRSQGIPIGTLHIIAHGKKGALNLAGNILKKDDLDGDAELISSWKTNTIKEWACDIENKTRSLHAEVSQYSGSEIYASGNKLSQES